MSWIAVAAAILLVVGLVGAVVQLPQILSHHINQPVQRARRERALRRKLTCGALTVLCLVALVYWLAC